MALQQDEHGFLVGETIQDIKRANKNTALLLKEVREIKKMLGSKPSDTQPRPVNPPAPPAQASNSESINGEQQSNTRHNRSRNTGNESSGEAGNHGSQNLGLQNSDTPSANSANTQNNIPPTDNSSPSVSPAPLSADNQELNAHSEARARDSRGRFLSNNEGTTDAGESAGGGGRIRNSRGQFSGNGLDKDTKDGGNESRLGGMFDGLGDRITAALDTQGLEEVDPTVKAFQETVEPLAKGYQFLFGSGNKQDKPMIGWLKKIFSTLKKTEKNTSENSGGGDSGFSLMGLIQGVATAAIAGWGLFTKDGGKFFEGLKANFIDPVVDSIGGWLKESAGYNKAVDWTSENIVAPVMGVINDPGQALIDLINNVGQLTIDALGVISGVFIDLSNAVGQSVINGWGAFTEWLAGAIMPMLTAGWNQIVAVGASAFDWFIKKFEPVANFAKSIFGFVGDKFDAVMKFAGEVFTSFSTFMKDKFGIDIPAAIDTVSNKAKELAQPAIDQADKAKQAVTDFAESAKKSATEATDTVKGFTAKMWDSAKGIGSAVVGGIGDVAGKIGNAIVSSANASEGNTSVAKVSEKQSDMMKGVYSSFTNAGFSEDQAKALTAEVGRENAYNPKNVFGSHTDAANGATNTGFFSWQGIRSTALKKRLAEKGLLDSSGNIVRSQEALNEQAKFAKEEMESGQYKGLGNFMDNKNVDSETAAKQLGKGYIKWAYGQDTLRSGAKFDWRSHDNRRAGYYNKLNTLVGSVGREKENLSVISQQNTAATAEQIAAAAPKSTSVAPQTVSVSNPSPSMPSMPRVPKIAESTPTIMPLTGGDSRGTPMPIMVSDIGQGLPDRSLAHIAQGGIGGI